MIPDGTYYSANYLSEKLGSSLTSVYNWRAGVDNGFPDPVVGVQGATGSRPTYGWSAEQIAEVRYWYAKRFKLDDEEAQKRWEAIDTGKFVTKQRASRDQCVGQLPMNIPLPSTSVENAA